ncbi:MAG: hypothetical protein SGARI_004735, partial [Bacillariaceae sp.]
MHAFKLASVCFLSFCRDGGKACAFCVNEIVDPSVQDPGCEDPALPNCDAALGEPGSGCQPECVTGPLNAECTQDDECCPFTDGFDGDNVGNCVASPVEPFFPASSTCVGQSCNVVVRRLQDSDFTPSDGFCIPGDSCADLDKDTTCANMCSEQCQCSDGRDPTFTNFACRAKGDGSECEGSCCGCNSNCEDFCCNDPDYIARSASALKGRLSFTLTIEEAFNLAPENCFLAPITSLEEFNEVTAVPTLGFAAYVALKT